MNEAPSLSLSDYYHILYRRKWFIIIFTFIMSVIGIGISLIIPKWYVASGTIITPFNQGSSLMSLSGNLPLGLGNMFGGNASTDRYLAILKSRTVKEQIIKKYNLIEEYDVPNIDWALIQFESNYWVNIKDEQQIIFGVQDKRQDLVADMGNYVLFLLDSINISISSQSAKNKRIFIEGLLEQNMEELQKAQDDLVEFMNKHGVIELTHQMQQGIEIAGSLYSILASKEIEYALLKQTVSSDSPNLEMLKIEISELKKKLHTITTEATALYPSLKDAPTLAMQQYTLELKLDYHKEIIQFLGPQFEEAKISEMKDIPTYEVLDYPRMPEKKSKPKRAYIVIGIFMFAFLSSSLYSIYRHILSE